MRPLRILACALSLVLGATLAPPASATSGEWVDVTCPVCANGFEGWEFKSTNTFGGVDRDFCEHALGDPVLLLVCWTCPRCRYTGFAEDFEAGAVSEELKGRLGREPLEPRRPIDPSVRRTTLVPAWVRWDLLLQVLERKDAPPVERAWAALRTAWTQRFDLAPTGDLAGRLQDVHAVYRRRRMEKEGEQPLRGHEGDVRAAALLERDAADDALPLSADERRTRLLCAAVLYKRRGEDPDAARVLERLRADPEGVPAPVAELAAAIEERIAREAEYLAKAVPSFERRLAEEGLDPEERACVRYLLAEVGRKAGRGKEAVAAFEALAADDSAPSRVRDLARSGAAWVLDREGR